MNAFARRQVPDAEPDKNNVGIGNRPISRHVTGTKRRRVPIAWAMQVETEESNAKTPNGRV